MPTMPNTVGIIGRRFFQTLRKLATHFEHKWAVEHKQLLLRYRGDISLVDGDVRFRKIKERQRGIGRIPTDDGVKRPATLQCLDVAESCAKDTRCRDQSPS